MFSFPMLFLTLFQVWKMSYHLPIVLVTDLSCFLNSIILTKMFQDASISNLPPGIKYLGHGYMEIISP